MKYINISQYWATPVMYNVRLCSYLIKEFYEERSYRKNYGMDCLVNTHYIGVI